MNTADKGTFSPRRKPPLDVRVVAYYLYLLGFLNLALALLLGSGIAKPVGPVSILAGTIQITGGLTLSLYVLCTGVWDLVCAWGLVRRAEFAWWLSLMFQIYWSIEWVVTHAKYPLAAEICIAINTAIVVWLLFRRRLYLG